MSARSILKRIIERILFALTPITKVHPRIVTLSGNELLKGRTALITGGTSGIGYEIAKAFVKSGASVIITGRTLQRVKLSIENLKRETSLSNIYGIELDVKNIADMENKFEMALKETEGRIDVLVNNAGVNGCSFSNGTEEEYDNVLDTNLKGAFFLSRIVAKYMKNNKISGNILNLASSSSLRPANSAYTLSKWGIRGLTQGLAVTLAPYGIVVNGIAPGPTATPMMMPDGVTEDISLSSNLTGRYALPEEIANMAVILVSDMSRMIIGDIVYMTGGSGIVYNGDVNYTFDI